jgi:hypothetical protein
MSALPAKAETPSQSRACILLKTLGCIPAASISASLRFSDFYWAFAGHHTIVARLGGAIRDGEAFGVQSTAEQLAHRRSPARHVPRKPPTVDSSKLVFSKHDLQAFATWVSHDGLLPDHVSLAQATTHTQFQLREQVAKKQQVVELKQVFTFAKTAVVRSSQQ